MYQIFIYIPNKNSYIPPSKQFHEEQKKIVWQNVFRYSENQGET